MTYPTLRERVRDVLLAANFRGRDDTIPSKNSRGTFDLKSGAGVEVSAAWWDATDAECRVLLERFAVALRDAGFVVEDRGDVLYVAEPEKRSDEKERRPR